MKKIVNEGLAYMDMESHVTPLLGIDQFASKIGDDSTTIVLNFVVDGEKIGEDLVDWLERGYEWIIDAEISPGEVLDKKYYVFAEMNRSSTAARRIIEVLEDLKTLTGFELSDWSIKIENKRFPASIENIEQLISLSAKEYDQHHENEVDELNEWRDMAGINRVSSNNFDDELLAMQRQARIK
jgi:hypothetical protein